jgi:hypothetical protein
MTPRALAARLIAAAAVALLTSVAGLRAVDTLPAALSDREYWSMIESFSEPGGYFQSDNLVSNERLFQQIVPALSAMKRGGVYLGVAPDQNFTYILGLEPKMAFILDIRRGNLHQHLMYKALFELSEDRAAFLSRLFARPRPADVAAAGTAAALFEAYRAVPPSDALQKDTLRAIQDHLTRKHGFALSPDDLAGIEYVYGMFVRFGPELTYSSSSGRGGRSMPTYAELQSTTDVAGENRAYLGSEDRYRAMKAFEQKNLLVPIVGDFAGKKALRAIGQYLAEHGASVSVFYTSNVEQYLFQNGVWREFYGNVATLPLGDGAAFLRSARGLDVLDPIALLLRDFTEGKIRGYGDITIRGGRP